MLLLVLALAGWGAYYAQDKGFAKKWRNFIHAEFEKRGMHATIRRLTLDPLNGLIARDVLVFEDPEHKILLMSINKVALDVDLTKLFSDDTSLRSLDVRDASISIPLDPGRKLEGEQLKLKNINARILMPEDRVEIVQAQADVEGIHISVTGSLFRPLTPLKTGAKPAAGKPAAPPPVSEQEEHLRLIRDRRNLIAAIQGHLTAMQFQPGSHPVLEIAVHGDMEKPSELRANGAFTTGPFTYGSFSAREARAMFEFRHGKLDIEELSLNDQTGKLFGKIEYDLATRDLHFGLNSTVDLRALLAGVFKAPQLNEVVFYQSPAVEVTGVYHTALPFDANNLPIQALGKLRSNSLASRGVIFEALAFDFSVDRDRIYLRNGRIEHKTGILTCDGMRTANGIQYRANVRLDPTVFLPFMALEGTRRFMSRLSLDPNNSALYLSVEGTGATLHPSTWHSKGLLDLRNAQFNGHPVDHLQCELSFYGKTHSYDNVFINRPEGFLSAKHIRFDQEAQMCFVEDMQASLDPVHGVGWFAPRVARKLQTLNFQGVPKLSVNGFIDVRPVEEFERLGPRHHYTVEFSSESSVERELFGRPLRFDKPTGKVLVKEALVTLEDFSAGVLGGKLEGRLRMTPFHNDPSFEVEANWDGVSYPDLAAHYKLESSAGAGTLAGSVSLSGRGARWEGLKGSGSAALSGGSPFAFPGLATLLKPVADSFSAAPEGFAPNGKLDLKFQVKEDTLVADGLKAEFNGIELTGSGKVNLDGDLFSATAAAKPLASPTPDAAPPIAFEFTGDGKLRAPVWKRK